LIELLECHTVHDRDEDLRWDIGHRPASFGQEQPRGERAVSHVAFGEGQPGVEYDIFTWKT